MTLLRCENGDGLRSAGKCEYKEFTESTRRVTAISKRAANETDRTLDVLNVKYVLAGSRFVDEMQEQEMARSRYGVFENLNVLCGVVRGGPKARK
jgi:hypothetical protein